MSLFSCPSLLEEVREAYRKKKFEEEQKVRRASMGFGSSRPQPCRLSEGVRAKADPEGAGGQPMNHPFVCYHYNVVGPATGRLVNCV